MTGAQIEEFMDGYTDKFDLKKDISFNSNVRNVTRNAEDTKWCIELEREGTMETREFDKVALCHGYQTMAKRPTLEGEDKFEGIIMHSQEYRG